MHTTESQPRDVRRPARRFALMVALVVGGMAAPRLALAKRMVLDYEVTIPADCGEPARQLAVKVQWTTPGKGTPSGGRLRATTTHTFTFDGQTVVWPDSVMWINDDQQDGISKYDMTSFFGKPTASGSPLTTANGNTLKEFEVNFTKRGTAAQGPDAVKLVLPESQAELAALTSTPIFIAVFTKGNKEECRPSLPNRNRPSPTRWSVTSPDDLPAPPLPPPPPPPPPPQKVVSVNAGPIWNASDANAKCPKLCGAPSKWNGQWRTTVPGKMSVCDCAAAPVTSVDAGPILNQKQATLRCPAVCLAPTQWNGQWRTTVPGRMSTCDCILGP